MFFLLVLTVSQLRSALKIVYFEIFNQTKTGGLVDQLNRILDVLGTPDEKVFDRICSEKVISLGRVC